MLAEIGNALIQSDVNIKLVMKLRMNLQQSLSLDKMATGTDKRSYITKVSHPIFKKFTPLIDSSAYLMNSVPYWILVSSLINHKKEKSILL